MKTMFWRTLTSNCTVALIVVTVVGSAYIFGYLTAEHKFFPQKYLARLNSIATSVVKRHIPDSVGAKSIPTIFLNLNLAEMKVPVTKAGSGGGLTSFGDELLLMTHDGYLFLVSERKVENTQVQLPANGLEEYSFAAKSDKYNNLRHNLQYIRYNDILYYAESGRSSLVISYTEWLTKEECYGTTIARLDLPTGIKSIMEVKSVAEDWKIVYRTQPCLKLKSQSRAIEGHMAGGRIAYLKSHRIILGNGDYGWDGVYAPDAYAQKENNDYGKVLEIDLNNGTARKLAVGNRNMQGVLVDSKGEIWVTEHGPKGGDELNNITEGGNFGWPEVTLGVRYNGMPWPGSGQYGRHNLYKLPTFSWVPSIAPSGLVQVQGFHPSWDGDLLVATLREQSLFRLRIRERRVIFAEPIKVGERIRYVHQHTQGRIVLWTDSKKLLFVSLGAKTNTRILIDKAIAGSGYNIDQQKRIISAIDSCAECHSFEPNLHGGAPSLAAIFESRIASTKYAQYSDALKSKSGIWTADQLTLFLQDTQKFAPGSRMPNPNIKDQFIIDGIVKILDKIKNDAE